MSDTEIVKPPLGLRPRYIVREERVREIKEAIKRYVDAEKSVPAEWLHELNEYTRFLDLSTTTKKQLTKQPSCFTDGLPVGAQHSDKLS
jgi:hypothetical protein